jgi:hypothetical protein
VRSAFLLAPLVLLAAAPAVVWQASLTQAPEAVTFVDWIGTTPLLTHDAGFACSTTDVHGYQGWRDPWGRPYRTVLASSVGLAHLAPLQGARGPNGPKLVPVTAWTAISLGPDGVASADDLGLYQAWMTGQASPWYGLLVWRWPLALALLAWYAAWAWQVTARGPLQGGHRAALALLALLAPPVAFAKFLYASEAYRLLADAPFVLVSPQASALASVTLLAALAVIHVEAVRNGRNVFRLSRRPPPAPRPGTAPADPAPARPPV